MMEKIRSVNLPTVSLIIPMRNEEEHIARCLWSVLNQDYPKDSMEVLVVDGMSEDSSREIVRDFVRRYPYMKLLDNPKRATASGLNMGIVKSRGQIIIRVDAHCFIDPDYINFCVNTLRETGAENVGGLMRPTGATIMEKAIALAMSSPFVTTI